MPSSRMRHRDMPYAGLRSEGRAQGSRGFRGPRFGRAFLVTFDAPKVTRPLEGPERIWTGMSSDQTESAWIIRRREAAERGYSHICANVNAVTYSGCGTLLMVNRYGLKPLLSLYIT